MRILAIDQFSQPGGAQQVLLELLSMFRQRGWDALVGLPGDGPLFESVHALGFRTVSLDCGPYRSGAKSAHDLGRFLFELPRLAGKIRACTFDYAPDLVYINGPRLLPAAALARPSVPVIFHSHSLVPPGASRVLCGLALRALGARVVAVCRFTAAQWEPFAPAARLRVVYNGVAGPACRRLRRPGPPHIGCIGRVSPEKGQLEFVQAARCIHAAIPGCRFSVIGAAVFGGPAAHDYASRVRSAAAGLPIDFPGWTADVDAALQSLDLLLVPSGTREATPRVIPEAWAAGVPVIAFASGGIPELVSHGANGFLVRSAEEMASQAIRLLTSGNEELDRVAKNGRETWSRRFTLEEAQRRWVDAITSATLAGSTTTARRTRPVAMQPGRES